MVVHHTTNIPYSGKFVKGERPPIGQNGGYRSPSADGCGGGRRKSNQAAGRFARHCSRFCSGRASKLHRISTEFNRLPATDATAITWNHRRSDRLCKDRDVNISREGPTRER